MPTHPSRALCLCAATLAVTLSGCGTEPLKTAPPPKPPQLAGNWTLDTANSGQIDAAVVRLEGQLHALVRRARRAHAETEERPKRQRRVRQQPRQDGDHDEGAPAGAGAADTNGVQEPSVEVSAPQFGASWLREFIASVPVGDYLGIGMPPGQFTVRSADGSQQCSLGVPTAITFGDGTADQTCGWQGRAFLIELLPLIGPRLTERFAIEPDGELMMSLHMSGHGINVRLIRRYRRTPHAVPPALLPTSD